jgi:diguanylate cyclase (GGDEF)-like protein
VSAAADEAALLRQRLREIHEEARRNEAVFERLKQRELELLNAQSLPDLLDALVRRMPRADGLDAAALVLDDPQHELRHLLAAEGVNPSSLGGVVFTDSVLALAPQARSLDRPWLGPWSTADHQLLFPGQRSLGSVALLPLMRGERLFGLLNFGSRDPARYTRQHAVDFLAHLAAIAGFCIDSAANRARLVRAGLTDYLTGWHNRRYLHVRLREELARAQRQGSMLALLMLDLDRFKQINDRCGHLGGDEALREVAVRVESQVRASDTAARFGGDEFAVLMPGAGVEDARRLAERIRDAVTRSPVEAGPGVLLPVTVSIGVAALAPAAGAADLKALADQLLAEADAALYRAKAAGRDRIVVHGQE